jgi:glycosyltransferase involved in cell wall biosynthesis
MTQNQQISLVLPTLGTRLPELERLFDSLEDQTYKNFEVIIVSQDNHEKIGSLLENFNLEFIHVPINKKGLSNARNIGLEHCSGQIVSFSDDDCWYLEDSFQNVVDEFNATDSSILCFQHYDPFKKRHSKQYAPNRIEHIKWRQLFNKASIEIFVNLDRIPKEDVSFDVRFGLGAEFPSGEENIFLMDSLKKGHQITYIPKIIAYHEIKGGNHTLNYKMFMSKGPMFKRMFNLPTGLILMLLLYAKKYNRLENKNKLLLDSLKTTFKFKK